MKIGFIGMGFVGGNTAKVFEEKHEIIPYDKYKKPYTSETNLEKIANESDLVFLSVPTPMKSSGEIDYSAIHDSLSSLEKYSKISNHFPDIVIRSTAVSGTTDKLEKDYLYRFAFNPEFLKERTALEDMKNTRRVVVGSSHEEVLDKVGEAYKKLFPNADYLFTDNKTAEMIKYGANIMLASQVAIANEIYQVCKSVGVDYEKVKNSILLDERIARNIDVPGPDGNLGFGGKCFPKDLNALIYLARENHYRPYLLEEVWRLNERLRKDQDWLDIPGATSENENFSKE